MSLLGRDGKELVDWIAERPWSDGNVGMTGQSYLGWSQFATASWRPEALRCIAPALIVFDTYSEGARPGGIMATKWLREYSDYLGSFNLNRLDFEGKYFPYLPAAPVIDEDGDGRLIDEIPLAEQGDPTLFTDDDPAVYPDGVARDEGYFRRATLEHQDNMTVSRFMEESARYFDASFAFEGDTSSYLDTSPGAMLAPIIEARIPVFNIGGWFDGFLKGTTKLYGSMAERGRARLLIGPRFHIPMVVTPAYTEHFGYDGAMSVEVWAEELRFFDWCLKGMDNGFEDEAPVKIFVMNSGWREEDEWPLARQEITPYHLHGDGRLGAEPAETGTDTYEVDFTHSSDYGSNRVNRWLLMQAPDTLMLRTELDEQTLVYETASLESDVEVTGHPVVHLWLSSDQDAGDVFVYLSDVDENGQVHYVTEGQLRAGFRDLFDPDMQTGYSVEVKPDLPWHGYREADFTEAVFAGGRIVDLRFDLMPTSWLFRAGHRIRISIAGADYGNFELNPALCSADDPTACNAARLHVHRGPATPSRIELPVIPAARR
jgi:predicted acyl esterase